MFFSKTLIHTKSNHFVIEILVFDDSITKSNQKTQKTIFPTPTQARGGVQSSSNSQRSSRPSSNPPRPLQSFLRALLRAPSQLLQSLQSSSAEVLPQLFQNLQGLHPPPLELGSKICVCVVFVGLTL